MNFLCFLRFRCNLFLRLDMIRCILRFQDQAFGLRGVCVSRKSIFHESNIWMEHVLLMTLCCFRWITHYQSWWPLLVSMEYSSSQLGFWREGWGSFGRRWWVHVLSPSRSGISLGWPVMLRRHLSTFWLLMPSCLVGICWVNLVRVVQYHLLHSFCHKLG